MTEYPRVPELIERPDLESSGRRRVGRLFNLIAWGAWIYLLGPLVALIGWLFGAERFQQHILDNATETLAAVQVYGLVIAAATALFIGWAGYNWIRFRGNDRRSAPKPVTTEALARRFAISTDDAEALRRARIATVFFDDDARITAIRVQCDAGGRPTSTTRQHDAPTAPRSS